jgi:OmpR family response regulator RpaB
VGTCNEKILVINSEIEVNQLLQKRLTSLGYDVFSTLNTKTALIYIAKELFDLVLIDAILSKFDCYDMCLKIRENSKIPIILLGSLGSLKDRVMILDSGADDYIRKPFSPKELEARILALLRRSSIRNPQLLEQKRKVLLKVGNLVINLNTKSIYKNDFEIYLTNIEYKLLELLVNNAGKKLSRIKILEVVWGYNPQRMIDTRIVDVNIARLRAKIEENSGNPDFIITARGVGYIFLDRLEIFDKH